MQTKLTFRLDDNIIKKVKAMTKKSGKYLLKIVEDYFFSFKIQSPKDQEQLPPGVRSLKGLLKGSKIDYYDYLEKKSR